LLPAPHLRGGIVANERTPRSDSDEFERSADEEITGIGDEDYEEEDELDEEEDEADADADADEEMEDQ
jgi:hypothetical protein